mgnify:FL=1
MKLPLSTTYVTFMVAMGSSLADRAWDRESAVYRISGVLTVISGWFMTAFSAATACGFVATLMCWLGSPMMILGMITAFAIIVRTNLLSKQPEAVVEEAKHVYKGDQNSIRELLTTSVNHNLDLTLTLYSEGLEASCGRTMSVWGN